MLRSSEKELDFPILSVADERRRDDSVPTNAFEIEAESLEGGNFKSREIIFLFLIIFGVCKCIGEVFKP